MQTIRYVLILCLFGCGLTQAQILPTFGNSRTGGSGMQFLKISPDARGMSLAGAAVANTNDASSMYWNPASITGVDTGKVHVQLSHTRYFGDITGNYAGIVKKVGKLSFVGFQVFSMNYGTMDETTEFESKGTGRTFTVSNYLVGLTYAKILTNSFSFGVNAKYANEGFGGATVHNALFDLGLKYDVGVKNTRFGINFSNFGFNVSPSGDVSVLKFNGPTDITSFSQVSVPGIFRLGIAFDPLHTPDHIITASGQLNHPTDNNETYALGAEYSYLKVGYLRTGYEFGSDEQYIAPSFGLGIKAITRFVGMNIDYGFLAKSRLGAIHRITLAINLR
jgi:Type IX secretion system protein PorV